MIIKKNTLWSIAIVIVLVIAGFFMFSQSGNSTPTVKTTSSSANAQIVKISVDNLGNYVLSPNTLTKGVPVRLEADMSKMPGCSKSIVIREFNVRKTFSSSDNVVEFTPTKSGTFWITCSMNMYQGQFTVVDDSGTKPSYVESVPTSGGSCGAGGSGGCGGCGGAR